MSTEAIFGGWSNRRFTGNTQHDRLQHLWHWLSAQPDQPNFGLSQRLPEIAMLWNLYIMQSPLIVLEIGTAQGGTFAGWCQLGNPDALIISIDRCVNDARPRPGDPGNPNIYNGPLAQTTNGGGLYSLKQHRQRVVAINGWSYEESVLARLREVLAGRKIDFIFHDASHSAEMFLRDFEIYWPLVADGGVFASHDIMPHPSDARCNKNEAWKHICETIDYSARFEFLGRKTDEGMGIGAIVR